MTAQPALVTPVQQHLSVRRCGVTVACVGVARLHRHHKPPPGAFVGFEVLDERRWPVGWATVGRPTSRILQGAGWAEVTRVATDGTPNACSKLYGAAGRWAKRKGYPLLTYTRSDEEGASLRGAGWVEVGATRAEAWSRDSRPRLASENETVAKRRWISPQTYAALVKAIAKMLRVWP